MKYPETNGVCDWCGSGMLDGLHIAETYEPCQTLRRMELQIEGLREEKQTAVQSAALNNEMLMALEKERDEFWHRFKLYPMQKVEKIEAKLPAYEQALEEIANMVPNAGSMAGQPVGIARMVLLEHA